MFNLHKIELPYAEVLGYFDRAIGVYEADQSSSWIRTCNPFWWANYCLVWISALPFKFLGQLGFDQKKAEGTPIGKILKGIFYLIPVVAGFLTILDRMDWLEAFKGLWK